MPYMTKITVAMQGLQKQWFDSSSLAMSFPVLLHVDARLNILSAHKLTVLLAYVRILCRLSVASAQITCGFCANYLHVIALLSTAVCANESRNSEGKA